MSADLSLSVIVPARDAEVTLGGLMTALSPSLQGVQPNEVVVVDDGSADATAELARAHGSRVVTLPGLGPAAARNAGAQAASGNILVFIDADCVPEPGCLRALLAPFADPGVAGVRGGYASRQRALPARFTQLEMEEKQARLAASWQIAVMDTACAAYRRDRFLAYGGFDESLPATSVEDVELSFRMAAGGERMVYAKGALVRHQHPERLVTYLWRKLRFGYFRARLYQRHPGRVREDGYTPRLMPIQILLTAVLALATLGSPWSPLAQGTAAAAALAFLATALPLVRRAWGADRSLALAVPAFLLARSLAQGLGLAAGLAHQVVIGSRGG